MHQIHCKHVNWKETCFGKKHYTILYFANYYIFDSSSFDSILKWIVEKGKGFQNAGKTHFFSFPLPVFEIFKKIYTSLMQDIVSTILGILWYK